MTCRVRAVCVIAGLAWLVLTAAGCAHLVLRDVDRRVVTADYAGAEKLLEARGPDLTSLTTTDLADLCFVYSRLKRYGKVFPCLDHFDRRIQSGDVMRSTRGPLMRSMRDMSAVPDTIRAETYLELGRYPEAIRAAERAYAITGQRKLHGFHQVNALGVLALSHAVSGDATRARQYAATLGTIPAGGGFRLRRNTALARVYAAVGDYQLSLRIVRNIVESDPVTDAVANLLFFGPGPLNTRAWEELPKDVLLARSLLETGNIREAAAQYDRLLATPQITYSGDLHWIALFDRGRAAEREGKLDQAIALHTRAIEIVEQQRSTINTEINKIGFVGDKQAVYARVIALLVSRGRDTEAFEYAERAKSRALVDLLASKEDYGVRPDEHADGLAALGDLASAEATALVQDDASAAEIGTRQRRTIEVKERLRTTAPELGSLVAVGTAPAARIQTLLREDETLVEFYYHGYDAYAFVLGRNQLRAIRLDARGLSNDVAGFRRQLETPDKREIPAQARALHRRLIAPIEAHLRTPHLIIVPHGVLHYLPFAALHSGERYLIERFSLRHLPSATVLTYLARRPRPSPMQLIAFGNPDLGDPHLTLMFAEREALAVQRIVPGARVLLGKDATETAFRRLAGSATHIHFAGHAQFDSDAALGSGLRLASDSAADGFLSVDEIYTLQLRADLVTLSACETGLGKVQNGDDVVGLIRGFFYAGANSIVASLWKVDDESTAGLMTAFYTALKSHSKRDALRAAQLETRARLAHPFYWAAFQLAGLAD